MDVNSRYIAVDCESDALVKDATLIHCAWFIGIGYSYHTVGTEDTIAKAQELVDGGAILVAHNAVYDIPLLRKFGLTIDQGQYACSMIGQHKVYSGRFNYGLDTLGETILGRSKLDYPDALTKAGLWDGNGTVWQVPYSSVMREYCYTDTDLCWELWLDCLEHFTYDARLAESFFGVHMPFAEVCISMQQGLYVNPSKISALGKELVVAHSESLKYFTGKYPKVAPLRWNKDTTSYELKPGEKPKTPNIKSPNDVASLLLGAGWVPLDYNFETKRPKTDQAALRYAQATTEPGPLLELVEDLQRVKSEGGIIQQLNTLLNNLHPDMFIYGNWKQHGTVTHRLASSCPNMQNFPTRNLVWGKKFRGMFTPPPGYSMLIGDFSQIELAILAYYLEVFNDDSTMADAARAGLDFHDVNTEAWYDVSPGEDGFKAKRATAKNGIFGANYGAAAKRLALTLGISVTEALEILLTVDQKTTINILKEKVWAVVESHRDVKKVPIGYKMVNYGIMYDALNTRVMYPDIVSNDKYKRSSSKRKVFNALMQTGCFSILADRCVKALPYVESSGGWFAALVHDEALLYCLEGEEQKLKTKLDEVFGGFKLETKQGGVPVRCEFHVVQDWSEK